jgi:hypothetical protein
MEMTVLWDVALHSFIEIDHRFIALMMDAYTPVKQLHSATCWKMVIFIL